MISILIMNGPNLNLLGTRQKDVYGATSLKEIETICSQQAASVGAEVTFFQSNHEGELIDQIHAARGKFDGIILNAGAYSHTSIAIMDALLSVQIPTIDMHLSNIYRREEFRHMSYVAKAAIGSIAGFGPGSYLLAIDAMMMHLDNAPAAEPAAPQKHASEPLATTRDQLLHQPPAADATPAPEADPSQADASQDAAAEEPETAAERAATPEARKSAPAAMAAEIAAAAASAIAEEKRRMMWGKADEPKAGSDDPEDKPEAEAGPAATADDAPQEPAEGVASGDSPPVKGGAFNEMFDTPSKDVLDSLGIAAPELYPPDEKKEAPRPAKPQGRSFRKLS